MEVSLVIGIVDCPSSSSSCPAASADLGDILFIGKFQSQGVIDNSLKSFENFTFVVPAGLSGLASFQAQHNFLVTPPVSSVSQLEAVRFGYIDSAPKGTSDPYRRIPVRRS